MPELSIKVSNKIIKRIERLIKHNDDNMTMKRKASILLEVGLNYAETADGVN